jgi:acetyl esterase/lipase
MTIARDSLLAVAIFTFAARTAEAQNPKFVWQPSPGHTQIPIWPGVPPDAVRMPGSEIATTIEPAKYIAGRSWSFIENVSRPTITVYSPKGKDTGAAVVVFPGGGYHILAIDLEGTEVCDWLVPRGITCVLLKYRVPGLADYPKPAYPHAGPYPESPIALEDAQRAISLVRHHAADWHIDPHKIGVLGFSAGGHMVAATSVHFEKRIYPAVDAADKVSCRPDFGVAIYPGHLSVAANTLELNPDIRDHITKNTPPTFLLQNEDDHTDRVEDALSYYWALKKAGVPVELHSYATGGHAFGLRRTSSPATHWTDLVETWLQSIGMTPRRPITQSPAP